MFYVVALGNPGEKYASTRHNIGWLILDLIRDNSNAEALTYKKIYHGRVGDGKISGQVIRFLYPETFMNDSGRAVCAFVPSEDLSRLIVLHDDIDLPLGQIKISFGRGSGGQNGVRSIIDTCGSNAFVRIRIGISKRHFWTGRPYRPTGDSMASFVLAPLTAREQRELEAIAQKVEEALAIIVTKGHVAAMNHCNASD